jgi:hypothetical protein
MFPCLTIDGTGDSRGNLSHAILSLLPFSHVKWNLSSKSVFWASKLVFLAVSLDMILSE